MFYFYILAIFWFIRTTKSLLFWLYLWQLKEYHFGRFIDHFRTEKGKGLLLNKFLFLKIALALILFYCIFFPVYLYFISVSIIVIFFILFLYFFESIIAIKNFFQKKLKVPVLTQKTAVLISVGLFFQILFLFVLFQGVNVYYLTEFAFWLLVFDILMPDIVLIIVFLFQPLTILLRNRILKKAKIKREKFKDLLVIGITGSYGKTSTKEFLTEILSKKYNVLKTKENHNSEIGISQCILQELKSEHQVFICEMAAYNKGGIKLLCNIVKPKIGIITGVNEQHLATFGSMENLLSAEGGKELIDSLPKDGIAFFNAKNNYCRELFQKTNIKKLFYGENAFFAGEENILGAMAVAKELGMNEQEISQVVEKIKNKFPGIEIKKGNNGLNIIDATYSANPTGVIAHLDYLKKWRTGDEAKTSSSPLADARVGKKIIIMPCLIELGSASRRVHEQIGEKLGEICDLAIITTKDKFNEIKSGAKKQGMKEKNILFLEDPKLIKQKLEENLSGPGPDKLGGIRYRQNSVVLLEGRISKQLSEEINLFF